MKGGTYHRSGRLVPWLMENVFSVYFISRPDGNNSRNDCCALGGCAGSDSIYTETLFSVTGIIYAVTDIISNPEHTYPAIMRAALPCRSIIIRPPLVMANRPILFTGRPGV